MNNREKMLADIRKNEPGGVAAPERIAAPERMAVSVEGTGECDPGSVLKSFGEAVTAIGGHIYEVGSIDDIGPILRAVYPEVRRVISAVPGFSAIPGFSDFVGLSGLAGMGESVGDGFSGAAYADVDLFIMMARLAVAENGAVWVTDKEVPARVLPFITQHLAVVIDAASIVSNLREAYERTRGGDYGFATYIAGPSRTADIEQSLVLGAHGSQTMTLFVVVGIDGIS